MFDLHQFSEATRRRLYDRIAASEFDGLEGPDPDEAGLQIVHFGGRWFALWLDPEAPARTPLHLRLRIVRIGVRLDDPEEIDLYEV